VTDGRASEEQPGAKALFSTSPGDSPKRDEIVRSVLDAVPLSLPTLLRAQELQRRAADVGFDWPDMAGVFDKVHEEIDELAAAEPGPDQEEEFGDVLLALVNIARKAGFSSEEALKRANEKFTRRFTFIEAACRAQGRQPDEMTLEQLDAFWNEAKAEERRPPVKPDQV
jgi:MazG family protein